MNRAVLSTLFFLSFLAFAGFSQSGNLPDPVKKFRLDKSTPTLELPQPNMEVIRQEDAQNDHDGGIYRFGVAAFTDVTPQNAGSWTTQPNGDRVWQLHIKYAGAEALSFLFSHFELFDQARMDVYGTGGQRLHRTVTAADVLEHFQQHIALCYGDEMTLQLTEPAGTRPSQIHLEQIMYGYRGTGNPNVEKDFGDSQQCEVNVNCSPVGNPWQDEKRGVARILVVIGSSQFWCSGSLVNNTSRDCKPLFLTAMHCMIFGSNQASASNFNNWKFYFRFEAAGCTNPGSQGTLDDHFITGCVKLATSNDNGGESGSDFLLVQLGTLANQQATVNTLKSANFNAYWNGWDVNNTAATGGAGIHHPNGDIKKISTFTQTVITSGWNGNGLASHWRFSWTANANGHGVTEGGSSGSPLFNNTGRVIGTLTGGASDCSSLSSQDYYGKMSYHWTSNGTPDNERLKTYLDPTNTGLLVMDGSADPCAVVTDPPPVADFSGTPTTVSVGNTVQFTDLSSNEPNNWSWSITPGTGWTYASGTSSSSQHPQVTFTAAGQYTIALTASNASGSDTETKINYITATLITGPCVATSTTCDEFINNVTLGTINSTSGCDNHHFFEGQTTVLMQGTQYELTIIPQNGTSVGQAYIDDEIAAWIDWNNDMDFDDAGERIAYVLVEPGWSNVFTFNVPETAATGQLYMRVRISYNGADNPDGPITPCGTTEFGEVEDYKVTVVPFLGIGEELFASVAIFPNPANDLLTIDLSGINEAVSIELVDITGKVITERRQATGTLVELDLSPFAKGSYYVRLSAGNNKTVRKVVKL